MGDENNKVVSDSKISPEHVVPSQESEMLAHSGVIKDDNDPGNNDNNVPLYKRRGMSETPEIQRKSRKLFPRYRNP